MPRPPAPTQSRPLPVRIDDSEDSEFGSRRVQRRRGEFTLSTSEALAGVPLLAMGNTLEASLTADASAAGYRGLHARALIRMTRPDPTSSSLVTEKVIGWGRPDAGPTLARIASMPLQKLGARTTAMLTQAAYVADGSRTQPLSGTEVAMVLRHRYLFTGVHALTITPATSLTGTTGAAAVAGRFEVVEHRHHQPDRTRTISHPGVDAGRLRRAAAADETDQRRTLLPADVEAMVLDIYFAGLDRGTSASARFDLDRLDSSDPAQPDVLDRPDGLAPQQWMPALLGDVLTHLQVRTMAMTTAQDYLTWARENLRYTVRCGDFTHLRHLDPLTSTVHTPPDVADRQAAEDMLAALLIPVGARVGCATDVGFVGSTLDMHILNRVTDQAMLRWLARAAQYIHAGLDLREAADFWFFGISTAQAADLIERRRDDEAAITTLLLGWCRDLFTKGTFVVPTAT